MAIEKIREQSRFVEKINCTSLLATCELKVRTASTVALLPSAVRLVGVVVIAADRAEPAGLL